MALLLSLVGLACATEPAAAPPPSQAQLASIQALIGDAPCEADAQCHSIGVGHKSCGGSSAYLAWSDKNVKKAELETRVAAQIQAARAEDERSGRLSNCQFLNDPGAVCRAKHCTLQPPAAALLK